MDVPLSHSLSSELLVKHEVILRDPSQSLRYEPGLDWTLSFPKQPGIYVVFMEGKPVYVGESGNVRARMSDLRRTMNHTLRRKLGNEYMTSHPQFTRVLNSKQRFHDSVEMELNIWMQSNLAIRGIAIAFGRVEIEEFLIETWDPKFNDKRARKL